MRRPISIRSGLLGAFVLVIVLLSGTILATAYTAARRAVDTASRRQVGLAISETEVRLREFFDPVTRTLLAARGWGESGLLPIDDHEEVNRLLVPLLRQQRHVSSIVVADERGHEHMLLRNDDLWMNRRTRPGEWQGRQQIFEWNDSEPTPTLRWSDSDYDPLSRPWFLGACRLRTSVRGEDATAECIHWTEPYEFHALRQLGLTASTAYVHDGVEHVIGVDLLLDEVSKLTTTLDVTPNCKVMVLTEDKERVIGLPRDPRFLTSEGRNAMLLKNPYEIGVAVIADGLKTVVEQDADYDGPVRFRSGGEFWYGSGRRVKLSPHLDLNIVVVIPESDLVGDHTTRRWRILLITVGVLMLAMALALSVSRRFGEPIEALVQQSDRISEGDLDDDGEIQSDILEVRQLAEAHDRMRLGLKSLIRLERDIQLARQIQRRTMPERVPQVPGFEIAAWNHPADETGGDAFDVIGYCLDDSGMASIAKDVADNAVIMLADATGHGIGPALSVTQLRSMLRMGVRTRQSLAGFAQHMNRQLSEDLPGGRFITAWFGQLNGKRGTLKSFSAGQAPLLHYVASTDEFDVRSSDTFPLGLSSEIDLEAGAPIKLRAGDLFAVMSDGIFEARNVEGEQFGSERVQDVLRANRDKNAADILQAVRDAVDAFMEGTQGNEDDQTVVIIRRSSENNGTASG